MEIWRVPSWRGREPPDAMSPWYADMSLRYADMSLRYADMSLPDLLGRPSLRYAEMSMRNTSKCACAMQEVLLN